MVEFQNVAFGVAGIDDQMRRGLGTEICHLALQRPVVMLERDKGCREVDDLKCEAGKTRIIRSRSGAVGCYGNS